MPGPNEDFENDLLRDLGETEDNDNQEQEHDDTDDIPDDVREPQDRRNEDGILDDDEDAAPRRGARREQEERPRREQQQDQNEEQTGPNDPFDLRARFEDRNGSLYLNGKLVAKAGRDRKIFEGFKKMAQKDRSAAVKASTRVVELAAAAKELVGRYNTLAEQKGMFEKAGLSNDEQLLMLSVASEYKKNPLNGIKLLLTKAQMAGVDIKSLGVAGAAFDPSVIVNDLTKHIDERLKPLNDMTATNADAEEARKEAEGFFDRNPEADDFAQRLKGKHRELALILKEARRIDRQAGGKQTLDQLWQQLHYKLLLEGAGDTRVVTKRQDQNGDRRRQNRQARPARRQRNNYTGDESYDDIGKDVLADIARLNAQG